MNIFSRWKSALTGLLLVALLVPMSVAQAAALTALSDRMSRQDVSTTSDHEIRFTTPTGVDANTDTITVTFPSGFSLGSVAFGDIDLSHGVSTGFETNETLAASPAAGVWGAAVSGQTITLTAPTDAAVGEITAGDKVVIRIGLNAAGGVNRITNPSTANDYTLSIGGTFGDSGNVIVPIISPGTIAVSATVGSVAPPPSGGGSGGGPSGTPIDGTPPVISNIQVINITANTVDIIWNTDENADSKIDYGLTSSYTDTSSSAIFVTSHTIHLNGLVANTLYHFHVVNKDVVGNQSSSVDLTFTTAAFNNAPIISNVNVINLADRSASIIWDTDVPATSLVVYGPTTAYGQTVSQVLNVVNHAVDLSGLLPNTTYHFRVQSTGPNSLTSTSPDFTFTTLPDTTSPSNVLNFNATPALNSVDLSWINPSDPDFSFVRILARTDHYPTGPNDGRTVYQGSGTSITDGGLAANVTVFYTAYAFDSSGNNSSGALASAAPFGPIPLPPTTTIPVVTTTIPVVKPPKPPVVAPPTTTIPTATTTIPTPTTTILFPPATTTIPQPTYPLPTTPRPQYFGAQGQISLQVSPQGIVGALVNQPVVAKVSIQGLAPIDRATIKVGGSTYALTPLPGEPNMLGASFIPSQNLGSVPASVNITYKDGSLGTASNTILVQGYHRVTDGTGPAATGLSGAEVLVYRIVNGGEQAYRISGSSNRMLTDASGFYGAVVENGLYRLKVQKDGYGAVTQDVTVTQNVLSQDVALQKSFDLAALLDALRSPAAQAAANIAGPLALLATIGALATAVSALNLFSYLYLIFSQPFLIFSRRKRHQWGVVYNALTKLPVELAVVRLVSAENKRVLQTRVTDAKGRYSFFLKPGKYSIEVIKENYKAPSELLKGEKIDLDYVDLYFGEVIEVKEETTLGVNIPLDPTLREEPPKTVILKRMFRRIQSFVGIASLVLAVIALIIAPSWLMAGLVLLQLLTYLLFRRLAVPAKPKSWGIIYEGGNKKKKLGVVVVRIFDRKFNKLLETQVTDNSGKYGFIVGRNTYFVTAVKDGYDQYKSQDVDYTKEKEAIVNQAISLNRKQA